MLEKPTETGFYIGEAHIEQPSCGRGPTEQKPDGGLRLVAEKRLRPST